MSKCISVCERKPDSDCVVLIASNYGVRSGFFSKTWSGKFQDHLSSNDEGMEDWDGVEFVVTHWMPLPEPPRE